MLSYNIENMRKIIFILILAIYLFQAPLAFAQGSVLGIHILHPEEITQAEKLIRSENHDEWHYVTIPFSYQDLEKAELWQTFFDQAKEQKIIPIIRLATQYQDNAWEIPDRYHLVKMIDFLSELNWPTQEKYIILFNEPNHAKEWGGRIDPAQYAQVLAFGANWATTEEKNFKVLPAGLDLAAANTKTTLDAFVYLDQMYQENPQVFDQVAYWNSHSYPNPAFSAAPQRKGRNSLSGFKEELAYLKNKTGKDFEVFITETGWETNRYTQRWLESYYLFALQHIWSDPSVKGVTPFVLQGAPGPFAGFSFLDENGQPTSQYLAFKKALETINQGN